MRTIVRAGTALILIGGLLLPTTRASAEDPVRHVVRTGDTCAGIAQRYYGDARLVDVLHGANPDIGRLPPPHVLREGTVILVPLRPAPSAGPDAQLTTVRNQVEVLNPDTHPGKRNDPLFRGNRVSTHDDSAADVTFRDESQVKLGERTLVIILGDAKEAAGRVTERQTTLLTGNLRALLAGAKKDVATSVATDAASVKVYSGEAGVGSDAARTTRLAVYAGSSTISAQGRTREVVRGFGSKAELGREPTPPRPLPIAPRWTAAPDTVQVDRGAPLTIAGEFDVAKTQRVASFHVQVARDARFREIAFDGRVPAGVKRFEIPSPGPGHFAARVSVIDDDGFEGPFGLPANVLVLRGTMIADGARRRLELDPPDAVCIRVGNTPLTWVKGPIDLGPREPIKLRCAPFETDPTTLIGFE